MAALFELDVFLGDQFTIGCGIALDALGQRRSGGAIDFPAQQEQLSLDTAN